MNQKEYFTQRQGELEREICLLRKRLEKFPPGKLVLYKCKKGQTEYVQWMQEMHENGKRVRNYIKKENRALATLLAQKEYIGKLIVDKENELKCADYFVRHRSAPDYLNLLSPESPISSLLIDNSLFEWEYEDYPKSDEHPEHLIVPAPKGEYVRSKSEALIAQFLFENKIPYRYENIHNIAGHNIATDFTVMHPLTRQIKLWEHFGRCDDPKYQPSIPFKMDKYIRAGYLPGKDLILTFEDSKNPLSYHDVQLIIKEHFT